jgi:hypothetical protein
VYWTLRASGRWERHGRRRTVGGRAVHRCHQSGGCVRASGGDSQARGDPARTAAARSRCAVGRPVTDRAGSGDHRLHRPSGGPCRGRGGRRFQTPRRKAGCHRAASVGPHRHGWEHTAGGGRSCPSRPLGTRRGRGAVRRAQAGVGMAGRSTGGVAGFCRGIDRLARRLRGAGPRDHRRVRFRRQRHQSHPGRCRRRLPGRRAYRAAHRSFRRSDRSATAG